MSGKDGVELNNAIRVGLLDAAQESLIQVRSVVPVTISGRLDAYMCTNGSVWSTSRTY